MADADKLVLILNGGSSSVKISLFSASSFFEECIWMQSLNIDLLESTQADIVALLTEALAQSGHDPQQVSFTVHRVVHGGQDLKNTAIIDEKIESKIEKLSHLAPVHNPIALKLIRCARKLLPRSAHLAVFDTAFHCTLSERFFLYPLPYNYYQEMGIRRFGFHGINHHYCSLQAMKISRSKNKAGKLVVCHLGNGASLAAVLDGKSIDTSMGFTPMEGLMMGARCGSIDPGIIFYLLSKQKFSAEELDRQLNNESGLLGVSGLSKNMQEIEKAMLAGNERAKLAFEIFVQKIRAGIASMTASLCGLDQLVFTGGIGEHSALVRQEVCAGLAYLGLRLDEDLNNRCKNDCILNDESSSVEILRIEAREDIQMYRECMALAGMSKP